MGPRRVGKTVMLQHTIQKLIDEGATPQKVIFITIENPVYNNIRLEQLFAYAREAFGSDELKGWTVIFDEIQYLKNWEVHLKTLVDSYRQTKFIASGSAAPALKYKSQDSDRSVYNHPPKRTKQTLFELHQFRRIPGGDVL